MARNTSSAYKTQILGSRIFCARVDIAYTDGTSDTLTDLTDFKQLRFVDECCGSEIEIGAAIINEARIHLNNRSGKFDAKEFFGARISARIGILVNGLPELLKMGEYIVDEPVSPGVSIQLTAYDYMILLDRLYKPGILFPATRGQLAKDICDQCGVILAGTDFPGTDEIVTTAPEDCTCRELIAAIAQLGGCFARANHAGEIEIRWFSDAISHTITSLRSKNVCTDDVTVTGITVYIGNDIAAQAGEDGYRLAIKDNLLLTADTAQEAADFLASRIIGMTFRPLSVSCKSDPSIEAGDRIAVVDGGKTYETYVTSTTFAVLEAQSVACNAASPTVNGSRRLSDTAKAIIESKRYTQQLVKEERTERETALAALANRLATGSGLYMTKDDQADGSTIYYMHDKSLLEDSGIVWKLTAEALGISTDGGETYPYGLDVSGTAILERIYTVGLNADYINSGTFVARDEDGNIVFSVNVETGQIVMKASSITMGASSLETYVNGVKQTAESAVRSSVEEFYQSTSATELAGGTWSTSQPTWQDGTYIWRRSKVTYGTGTVEYSPSEMGVCITGNTGNSISMRIQSSRGTMFKDNQIDTVLSVVIYYGAQRITDSSVMKTVFGTGAYLQWRQQLDDSSFEAISSSDSRIGDDGFVFTVASGDVDTKATFMCDLII